MTEPTSQATCEYAGCDRPLDRSRSWKRYCCESCRSKAAYRRRTYGAEIKTCLICAVKFVSDAQRKTLCSDTCQATRKADTNRPHKREHARRQAARGRTA